MERETGREKLKDSSLEILQDGRIGPSVVAPTLGEDAPRGGCGRCAERKEQVPRLSFISATLWDGGWGLQAPGLSGLRCRPHSNTGPAALWSILQGPLTHVPEGGVSLPLSGLRS